MDRPMAHQFLKTTFEKQNSRLLKLLSHNVIYEVFLILDDCHKHIKRIVTDRQSKVK